jgi:hypothetical protein
MVNVEVTNQHGGYIRSSKDLVTGLINVKVFNPRKDEESEYLLDPKDEFHMNWLKSVYQPIHLEILLGEEVS